MKLDSGVFRRLIGPALQAELQSWRRHTELSKLVRKLDEVSKPSQFLDHFAECAIARHFLRQGCTVAVEVPAARKRHADLELSFGNDTIYAHVKRLNPDRHHSQQKLLEPIFESLQTIPRPVHVELALRPDLTHEQANEVRDWAKAFVRDAVKGHEATILSATAMNWSGT